MREKLRLNAIWRKSYEAEEKFAIEDKADCSEPRRVPTMWSMISA
jgi:hypothetical protein